MLDLENLKKVHSFEEFFSKLGIMVQNSKLKNDLFTVNRFNLHFLSKSPLDDIEFLFADIQSSISNKSPNIDYMYITSQPDIVYEKAFHELIIHFNQVDAEKLNSIQIGRETVFVNFETR
jgi:hypothetical protein